MSLRDVTFVVEDGSLGNSGSTGTGVHVKIGASPVETTVPIQLIWPAAGVLLGGVFMVIHMISQVCHDILRLTGREGKEAK